MPKLSSEMIPVDSVAPPHIVNGWGTEVFSDAVTPKTDSFHRAGRPVQFPCDCGFVAYGMTWTEAGKKMDQHMKDGAYGS